VIVVTVREKGGEVSRFEFSSFPIEIERAKGNDIVLPRGNVATRFTSQTSLCSSIWSTAMAARLPSLPHRRSK